MTDRRVTLAAITGAHGVRGEVRLKLFGDSAESLKTYRDLFAGDVPVTLAAIRAATGGAVARFAEIADRNAAEALRGTLLTVARASLPPLAPDEYYHADIIGLPVLSPDGTALGEVVGIENYGAGDILDIRLASGKAAMLPFTPVAVPEWNDARLVVDPAWLA